MSDIIVSLDADQAACFNAIDERGGHTRDRLLARTVNLGEVDVVGPRERAAEVSREVARARVEMRLESGDDAPAGIRSTSSGERRANFRGMVRIVIDHPNAIF